MIIKMVPEKKNKRNLQNLIIYLASDKYYETIHPFDVNIQDLFDKNERTAMKFSANLGDEDFFDLDSAIELINNSQDLYKKKGRSKRGLDMHYVVSFTNSDKDVLTPQKIKLIESDIATKLGLRDHQRLCFLHTDTDNLHLHVVANHVNNVTNKIFNNSFVHKKIQSIIPGMIKKYGLEEIEPTVEKKSANNILKMIDARSVVDSFYSYVTDNAHKELRATRDWEEFHKVLNIIGLKAEPKSGGLVFKEIGQMKAWGIKASTVDRSFSLKNIEARFGKYRPFVNEENTEPEMTYRKHVSTHNEMILEQYKTDRDNAYKVFRLRNAEIDRTYELKKREIYKESDRKYKIIYLGLAHERNHLLKQLKLTRKIALDAVLIERKRLQGLSKNEHRKFNFKNWINDRVNDDAIKETIALKKGIDGDAPKPNNDSGKFDFSTVDLSGIIKDRVVVHMGRVSYTTNDGGEILYNRHGHWLNKPTKESVNLYLMMLLSKNKKGINTELTDECKPMIFNALYAQKRFSGIRFIRNEHAKEFNKYKAEVIREQLLKNKDITSDIEVRASEPEDYKGAFKVLKYIQLQKGYRVGIVKKSTGLKALILSQSEYLNFAEKAERSKVYLEAKTNRFFHDI